MGQPAKQHTHNQITDFMAMLHSHPEIKYYTRWKTAFPILEDETIFRSAKDDSERRRLYDEYLASLAQAHDEKLKEDRKSALEEPQYWRNSESISSVAIFGHRLTLPEKAFDNTSQNNSGYVRGNPGDALCRLALRFKPPWYF